MDAYSRHLGQAPDPNPDFLVTLWLRSQYRFAGSLTSHRDQVAHTSLLRCGLTGFSSPHEVSRKCHSERSGVAAQSRKPHFASDATNARLDREVSSRPERSAAVERSASLPNPQSAIPNRPPAGCALPNRLVDVDAPPKSAIHPNALRSVGNRGALHLDNRSRERHARSPVIAPLFVLVSRMKPRPLSRFMHKAA